MLYRTDWSPMCHKVPQDETHCSLQVKKRDPLCPRFLLWFGHCGIAIFSVHSEWNITVAHTAAYLNVGVTVVWQCSIMYIPPPPPPPDLPLPPNSNSWNPSPLQDHSGDNSALKQLLMNEHCRCCQMFVSILKQAAWSQQFPWQLKSVMKN